MHAALQQHGRGRTLPSWPSAAALAPEGGRMISGMNPGAGSQAQGARTVDRVCENGGCVGSALELCLTL